MEFWGIEVKPGQTVKCDPGLERYLHLSQASLGEAKKGGNVSVPLYANFEGKKLVIGTLSSDKFPQISYDLVFEKEFELSHSWKDGSVFFTGYKTKPGYMDSEEFSETDSESERHEAIPLVEPANGKPAAKKEQTTAAPGKAKAAPSKAKGKVEEPAKPKEDEDDDEDDDNDESLDDSSDEDMVEGEDNSDDEDDSDDEEDEESSEEEEKVTPKKAVVGKKRPAGSESKTPVQEKKAKVVTPAGKPDGKKGGHTATPYPNKQAAKANPNDSKTKPQTPKSAGSFACKSCSKTFNSDGALQSHTKAKHGN